MMASSASIVDPLATPGVLGAATDKPRRTGPRWPALKREAMYGLAGEIVRAIEPHSEADPVGLLVSFLVAFGNACGSAPHAEVEEKSHPLNLFVVTVGDTAKGRKGTAWGRVERLMGGMDSDWAAGRITGGLSSGEGLINAVRDASDKKDDAGVALDAGVQDKRLLVIEEEFAATLKVMGREGNTLSTILRQAWDARVLRVLNKNSPLKASGAHISIIGHCTAGELRRYLTETEAGNGFANRFLWVCVRRSKVLPEGGGRPDWRALPERLRAALRFARLCVHPVRRDAAATEMWARVYEKISDGRPGLLGAVTSRAEAQVLRLSVLYAVLDESDVVRREHLLAALALWEYCEASARYVFGNAAGDPVIDRVTALLEQAGPQGLSNTDISDALGRHVKSARLQTALAEMEQNGLVEVTRVETDGRPRTVYVLCADERRDSEGEP